jgi:manganese transport protein
MNQQQTSEGTDVKRGMLFFASSDPQALEKEKAELAKLECKGFLQRWHGYFKLTGPGWLQSALTLGGGTAMASLFAGAYLQYKVLWVQPISMALGTIMLAAISYQTLSTGVRPFSAIKSVLRPWVAWVWVLGALTVTIIWHFPQYALTGGMVEDLIKVGTGWEPSPAARTIVLASVGVIVLIISTIITFSYGSGRKGIRMYEKMLKCFVWLIIIAFTIVVVRRALAGGIEWGKVGKGFLPVAIPTDQRGISIVIGAFSATVGVNSTFLLAYTLLARGWTSQYHGLSRFDLIGGMLVPFCIVTSLIVIAAGCTIYDPQLFAEGSTALSPTTAAAMFESAGLSKFFSRIVFSLGVLGMTLSTITVHMLICGFAACEMFGVEPTGWRYRLACLIPAPAASGVIIWKFMGPWIAVLASAICGLLLPFIYVVFFILHNSTKYLGKNKPKGKSAILWNVGMILAILASLANACYYIYSHFL